MEDIQTKRRLSNAPDAVRKRLNRCQLREKRREDAFIKGYVETKYPDIYAEAKNVYETFTERYPDKCDITKTYYYKKWKREAEKTTSSATTLTADPSPVVVSTISAPFTTSPTAAMSSPAFTSPSTSTEHPFKLYVPYLPILSNMCENTHDQMEIIQEGQQSIPQQSQERTQQVLEETEQLLEETQQFLKEIQQTEEETLQNNNDLPELINLEIGAEQTISGMSLSDMEISVQEIVKALQNDHELMDIVEKFDLPNSVWDNELAIPDYILEDDLEW